MYYVIRVLRHGEEGYLFNNRVLLGDIALAKPFTTSCMARRYLKKTSFFGEEFRVIQVEA